MKQSKTADEETVVYHRRRKLVAIISLVVFLLLFIGLSVFFTKRVLTFNETPESFKEFIDSFGWKGRFVALGIQILQVIIAFIPGELVEVGIGYAFGAIEGTLLCMAGIAIASSLIFLLTKWLGIRLVEVFVSREKIDQLRFINSEQRLKRTIFLLFFIPGTPKDLFTFFVGLTRIRLHEFLIVSLIARIPSVLSSILGGNLISEKRYVAALVLFLITGAVSLAGMYLYSYILRRKNRKKTVLDKNSTD